MHATFSNDALMHEPSGPTSSACGNRVGTTTWKTAGMTYTRHSKMQQLERGIPSAYMCEVNSP